MRSKKEVQEAETRAFEEVWLDKSLHHGWNSPTDTTRDPVAIKARERLYQQRPELRERESEEDQYFTWDERYGVMKALRWMLGMDWDEEGIGDT